MLLVKTNNTSLALSEIRIAVKFRELTFSLTPNIWIVLKMMYSTCLELIPDNGIIVDNVSDPVEELDDLFGHVVAGSSLTANIYFSTFLTFSLACLLFLNRRTG